MIQKAIRVGSSIAVTIPKKALEELGIKAGDMLAVSVDADAREFKVRARGTDSGAVEWARGFMKKYDAALKALAK